MIHQFLSNQSLNTHANNAHEYSQSKMSDQNDIIPMHEHMIIMRQYEYLDWIHVCGCQIL